MTNCWFLGVDPGGSSGCLAAVATEKEPLTLCLAKATDRQVWEWLGDLLSSRKVGRACLEKVHAFPRQGVASTFKFGQSYGSLRMALIAKKIPFEEVPPQTWQSRFVAGKTRSREEHKRRLRARAEELFPDVKVVKDNADALLLALYCQLTQ